MCIIIYQYKTERSLIQKMVLWKPLPWSFYGKVICWNYICFKCRNHDDSIKEGQSHAIILFIVELMPTVLPDSNAMADKFKSKSKLMFCIYYHTCLTVTCVFLSYHSFGCSYTIIDFMLLAQHPCLLIVCVFNLWLICTVFTNSTCLQRVFKTCIIIGANFQYHRHLNNDL